MSDGPVVETEQTRCLKMVPCRLPPQDRGRFEVLSQLTVATRCETSRIAFQDERQLIPLQTSCLEFRIEQGNMREYHGPMLNRWHRLSLQVKITLIIICIVGISAGTTEWLEARSIQHTVEDNVRRRGAGRRAIRRPERDQSCPAVESGGTDQRAGEDPGHSAGSTQHRAVRVSS